VGKAMCKNKNLVKVKLLCQLPGKKKKGKNKGQWETTMLPTGEYYFFIKFTYTEIFSCETFPKLCVQGSALLVR